MKVAPCELVPVATKTTPIPSWLQFINLIYSILRDTSARKYFQENPKPKGGRAFFCAVIACAPVAVVPTFVAGFRVFFCSRRRFAFGFSL